MAALSLYPTKNLGAVGEQVHRLRQYGWDAERRSLFAGINSRLDELQAAILRLRLAALEDGNAARRRIADLYDAGLDGIVVPPRRDHRSAHVFHQYVVEVEERDRVRDALAARGIATAIHYPVPIHRQPAYADRIPLAPGGLPVTDAVCARIMSLPIYPELPVHSANQVVQALCELLSNERAGTGPQ